MDMFFSLARTGSGIEPSLGSFAYARLRLRLRLGFCSFCSRCCCCLKMASQSVNKRLAWSFTLALWLWLWRASASLFWLQPPLRFPSPARLDSERNQAKIKAQSRQKTQALQSWSGAERVEWLGVCKGGGEEGEESHGVLRELLPPTSMVT